MTDFFGHRDDGRARIDDTFDWVSTIYVHHDRTNRVRLFCCDKRFRIITWTKSVDVGFVGIVDHEYFLVEKVGHIIAFLC